MPTRFFRVAAIVALALAPAGGSSAEVVINRVPAPAPRPRAASGDERGEKLGMGLVYVVGGVVLFGWYVAKSRRDD